MCGLRRGPLPPLLLLLPLVDGDVLADQPGDLVGLLRLDPACEVICCKSVKASLLSVEWIVVSFFLIDWARIRHNFPHERTIETKWIKKNF